MSVSERLKVRPCKYFTDGGEQFVPKWENEEELQLLVVLGNESTDHRLIKVKEYRYTLFISRYRDCIKVKKEMTMKTITILLQEQFANILKCNYEIQL